jgi:hypothetical protein
MARFKRSATNRRQQAFFLRDELPRLAMMIVFLGVLWLLMIKARDPSMWRWLASDEPRRTAAGADARAASKPEPKTQGGEAQQHANPPIDEDSDEQSAAVEEFQAVSDGTTAIQPEEMFAYRRLLSWVRQQTLPDLRARAPAEPSFNELMQRPAELRGTLARLSLHVRRVLSYENHDPKIGESRLYELWGWSDQSPAWLYVVVTPELPAGMPIGAQVEEDAEVFGYFFKLQGYQEASAPPRAEPLRAPLFVGRLDWHSAKKTPAPFATPKMTPNAWFGIIAVALIGLYLIRLAIRYAPQQRSAASFNRGEFDDEDVGRWLAGDPNACTDQTTDIGEFLHSSGDPARAAEVRNSTGTERTDS